MHPGNSWKKVLRKLKTKIALATQWCSGRTQGMMSRWKTSGWKRNQSRVYNNFPRMDWFILQYHSLQWQTCFWIWIELQEARSVWHRIRSERMLQKCHKSNDKTRGNCRTFIVAANTTAPNSFTCLGGWNYKLYQTVAIRWNRLTSSTIFKNVHIACSTNDNCRPSFE